MRTIISVKNLNEQKIFSNFNFAVLPQKWTTILGTNGCGKTTLLKILCGKIKTSETVIYGYSYLESLSNFELYKNISAVFPYEKNYFIRKTVKEELSFPLENLEYNKEDIIDRIEEISHILGIENLLQEDPNKLSKTEQCKVLIALAVMHKPKVLLLDDPFGMMTNDEKKQLYEALKKWKKQGMTIVMTTNNLEDVIQSDYLYVMNKGKLILEGNPLSVLQEEKILTRLGMKLPFMVDLSLKLKYYNLIDDIILDMDRLVDTLWKSN